MRAIYYVLASYVFLWTAEGGDLEEVQERSDAQASYPYAPFTFASCAENDTVREARIAAIRDEILTKLRLTQTPQNPKRPPLVNKSTMSAYNAAVQTAGERSTSCGRGTFYAKQLWLYFPTRYLPIIPPAEIFDWGKSLLVVQRGVYTTAFAAYHVVVSWVKVGRPARLAMWLYWLYNIIPSIT